MTAAPITMLKPEIERDRWGRPLVVPPTGGPSQPYTRATTFVGAIEDTYGIGIWKQRMTALGLADRPDLLMKVVSSRGDNRAVDAAADDAFVAAGGNVAATVGTALHLLTEKLDSGEELGQVPEQYAPDLAAYEEATSELKCELIEAFCVQDKLKVGGTPDRVVKHRGKRYIADLKTGSIDKGYLKIAAQLAMYARSRTYDISTGQRGTHGAEIDRGILIHLPAGSGTCKLYWLDLLVGWEAVLLANNVREARKQPFRSVVHPWDDDFTPKASLIEPRDNKPVGGAAAAAEQLWDCAICGGSFPPGHSHPDGPDAASTLYIERLIRAATDIPTINRAWSENQPRWTAELTALASARKAELSAR